MARTNARTAEDVCRDIAAEREQLSEAVEDLRAGIGEVTDVAGKLRARLPVVAAAAVGVGFFVAGGMGASMRYLARRGREGKEKARVGRFSFIARR
jgi:hypothetical protein